MEMLNRVKDLKVEMRVVAAAALCATVLLCAWSENAEARRGGRFVSSMISRGIGHGLSSGSKSYTADTLRVEQLVECLKTAKALDDQSDALEELRDKVRLHSAEVDASSTDLERKQGTVNRYSQSAIDRFNAAVSDHNAMVSQAKRLQGSFNNQVAGHNAEIERYNANCAKRYYSDDMERAKGLGHRPIKRIPKLVCG